MEQQEHARNAQSGHVVIERTDTPQPLYYSEKIARDFGSSVGWSADREGATVLSRADAEARLKSALTSDAPNCKMVPA